LKCSRPLCVDRTKLLVHTYLRLSYWPSDRSAWTLAHRRTPRTCTVRRSGQWASPAPRCRWIDCNAANRRRWWHL